MKILRQVGEPEVIAEFLKNEFYQEEFDRYREQFEQIVIAPDLDNVIENRLRKALLYLRRGHMWRELPDDTVWFEVQIESDDLPRIQVFPRAQWRRISNGSFQISSVVERIRNRDFSGVPASVLNKIHMLRYRMRLDSPPSTVLLIGVNDHEPLVILEGNHRLAAALLVSSELINQRFRVFCGLSPRMGESCWYHTSFGNLWRYARNRVRTYLDPGPGVEDLITALRPALSAAAYAGSGQERLHGRK